MPLAAGFGRDPHPAGSRSGEGCSHPQGDQRASCPGGRSRSHSAHRPGSPAGTEARITDPAFPPHGPGGAPGPPCGASPSGPLVKDGRTDGCPPRGPQGAGPKVPIRHRYRGAVAGQQPDAARRGRSGPLWPRRAPESGNPRPAGWRDQNRRGGRRRRRCERVPAGAARPAPSCRNAVTTATCRSRPGDSPPRCGPIGAFGARCGQAERDYRSTSGAFGIGLSAAGAARARRHGPPFAKRPLAQPSAVSTNTAALPPQAATLSATTCSMPKRVR